jgi:hypothetical protein
MSESHNSISKPQEAVNSIRHAPRPRSLLLPSSFTSSFRHMSSAAGQRNSWSFMPVSTAVSSAFRPQSRTAWLLHAWRSNKIVSCCLWCCMELHARPGQAQKEDAARRETGACVTRFQPCAGLHTAFTIHLAHLAAELILLQSYVKTINAVFFYLCRTADPKLLGISVDIRSSSSKLQ